MFKKLLSFTVIAMVLTATSISTNAFAEDNYGVMPINDTSEETPISETEGEIAEPTDDASDEAAIDLEEGTTPEADKADETEGEDEEGEPESWPMYVSLGALGVAVLLFIILNLFGRKKH